MKKSFLTIIRKCIPDIIVETVYKVYGFADFHRKTALSSHKRFPFAFNDIFMYLNDQSENTDFDGHYIYHPAWAARIVAKNVPQKHIDISSSLTFATMLSAFIPVEFYEYQPSKLYLSNLTEKFADLYCLPFEDNSVISLSCMHVVEHIGLGRYGDPIDPEGDIKAAGELSRVRAVNGTLLFVVPVGKAKLCYNAHRIYSYKMVLDLFPELILKSFSMVTDTKQLIYDCDPEIVSEQKYACGCFEFTKPGKEQK